MKQNIFEILKICCKKTPWRRILNFIPAYKPGKPIEEVRRELGLEKVIKLASNENSLGPSPRVLEAIAAAAKDVNRYPDGTCFYLRKALSKKLSVSEDNIVFGNGSDEIILLAARAFIASGEVVIADPTFLIYRLAAIVAGAKVRMVPLKNYKYDLDGMRRAINKRTKIVFIANPDNPTGSYVTADELNKFIESIPKDVLVFLDEAYYDYATGGDYPETIDLIKREDLNVVITRTFSKSYGLAGLRIGYGLAKPAIAQVLNKVREPFSINSVAQAAAFAALEEEEYLKRSVSLVREEMKRFYQLFDSLGVKGLPSRANFILVDTGRDAAQVYESLLKRGVIVREMSLWGLDDFIRVNIGLPEENEMFFKAFEEVIKEVPEK